MVNDTLKWKNNDDFPHTVTSGDPVNGPTGEFDSGILHPNDIFMWIPHEAKDIAYFDTLNPELTHTINIKSSCPRLTN